ncbi:MAG: hypothetical protein JST16_18350 [Bdellovibrionales bacterium]|nr:hypothetical protein [Bdellovibrionales bacterium]
MIFGRIKKNFKTIGILAGVALASSGCGKKSSSSTYSADKPSAIMGAVAGALQKVGSGMSASTGLLKTSTSALSSSLCDTHGEPKGVTNQSSSYAGLMTYCKLSVDDNSPETVQGLFTGIKGIACMVEKANPTYDGAAHSFFLPTALLRAS